LLERNQRAGSQFGGEIEVRFLHSAAAGITVAPAEVTGSRQQRLPDEWNELEDNFAVEKSKQKQKGASRGVPSLFGCKS